MTGTLTTLVNGEPACEIPASDRGLLYGDGLFETFAVREGQPQHWHRHMSRLLGGCEQLGMQAPDSSLLAAESERLVTGIDKAVLKLILTRGSGGRGYAPPESTDSTRIMQLHPWPDYPPACSAEGVRLRLCKTRLGRNPVLAGIKHLNRLEQVLARQEWSDAEIREGLLMDSDSNLIEGTMSNLFVVIDDELLTPDLSYCGVAGIMRTIILEQAEQQGIDCRITNISEAMLTRADEVFLCNSLIGIWPVIAIGEKSYIKGDITQQLQHTLIHVSASESCWRA